MQGNELGSLLLLLLPLLLVGYVFFGQRRRVREMQAVQASVAVGDHIRTTSGLFGRVVVLTDADVTLEVCPGVTLRFDRRAIDVKVDPPGSSGSAAADEQK
jgi:preprotein translocase subunit YajC